MGKKYETAIRLGAELDAKFGKTLSRAEKAITRLAKEAAKLGKQSAAIKMFQRLQTEVADTDRLLAGARAEVKRIGQEMLNAGRVTDRMKASFKAAEKEAKRLEKSLAKKRSTLSKVGAELKGAGIDVRNLSRDQKTLQRQLFRTKRKMEGLALVADAKLGKALGKLGRRLRGVGIAATGVALVGLAKIGKETLSVEEALAKLSTLETVTTKQLAETHKAAIKWTEAHGGSVSKFLDSAYNAVSSTIIETGDAIAATEQSAKLAKATFADQALAMDILGGLYVNVADKTKPAADELERLSDILAKTQQAAKIKDLPQLAKGLEFALPAAIAFGVEAEQVAAIMGTLNTAAQSGSTSGTNFAAALGKMGRAGEKLRKFDKGFQVAENLEGGIDVLETVRRIDKALKIAESQGVRAGDVLTAAFGERGMRSITALRKELDAAVQAQADLGSGIGTTQRAFDKMDTTTLADIERLQAKVNNKFAAMGRKLLPIFERKLPAITRLIDKMPAAFEALFEAGSKIWAVVDALGGVETILVTIAAVKLFGIAKDLVGVASSVSKIARGAGKFASTSSSIQKLGSLAGALNPVALAVAAIAAAIAAVTLAIEHANRLARFEKTTKGSVAKGIAVAAGKTGDRKAEAAAAKLRADAARRVQEEDIDRAGGFGAAVAQKRSLVGTIQRLTAASIETRRDFNRGAASITYSPNITVQGGAQAGPDVQRALRTGADDLEGKLRDERRRSMQ